MRSISFDCRTQSNSIHRLSSIEFDLIRLKFSSIGFDLLCRAYGKHSLTYLGPKLWRNLSGKERLAILIPLNRKNKRDLSSLLKSGSVYRLLSMQFQNVCKITVFTVKTFVFDLLSLLMYYIYIYIYI